MNRRSLRRSTTDILLVEPNGDDVRRFRDLFDAADAQTAVHVVSDADEALDFVDRCDDYADAPSPDLVLLDPELPREKGYDLLSELKTHSVVQPVPVIVVSGTDRDDDVVESYRRHANAYLPKPDDPARFDDVVGSLVQFWLEAVQLPQTETT